MNITSTPFIRNDYWPDYNELNELNGRIDEVENELSLTNINLTDKIENVEGNLNAYISQQNNTVITNNVVVNNINANYATGDFLNFNNVNLDNVYVENLTVNKPVFDITLNTPHIDNITVTGGNIFNTNIVNCEINTDNIKVNNLNVADGFAEKFTINELTINKSIEPVTSSAVLGYDATGKVIPVRATYDVSFPEDANYLYTDHFGTAYAGTAETEVTASDNLITANAVYNEALNITGNIDNLRNDMNNEFNIVNDNFANIDNNFNDVANNFNIVNNNFADIDNNFNDVANNFNDVANSFNNVNNTANNLFDNIDYLKNIVESSLLPANITSWDNSTYPVNIQGITEFAVEPLSADYYPISPGSARIRFNGNYYKKSGNDYVKQSVTTYNTYTGTIHVDWSESNYYTAITKIIKDPDTGERHKVTIWQTANNTIATSGYYLARVNDHSVDGTYKVKLLSLTFDGNGTSPAAPAEIASSLHKLPSDFYFQDSVFYYVKNGNNFEGLKVNQGQCTFTTDPITDNNFYIYLKGDDWSYPNTTGPRYPILAQNNVYAATYSASSFPLYTEIGAMTAYVSDKAKLSVSGTKATLALPGFQWTMESMNHTFTGCLNFNQNVRIPYGVTTLNEPFAGCLLFNQNILIPNSVTNMYRALGGLYIYKDEQGVRHTVGCPNLNQNILIPNSVTSLVGCFLDDYNLNQNILIPNSVTSMASCFANCNNLNQPDMYIYSQNIESMGGAFTNCHINKIHIPTSVPKSTSNFMYNCLVNGNTGITFPAANIFNDLPVDIGVWPPVA